MKGILKFLQCGQESLKNLTTRGLLCFIIVIKDLSSTYYLNKLLY